MSELSQQEIQNKFENLEKEKNEKLEKAEKTFYTHEQVNEHNKESDVWVIIKNKIYDVTSYLDSHPGGPTVISNKAGKDVTKPFDDVGHNDSTTVQKKMKDFQIGVIDPKSLPLPNQIEGQGAVNISQIALVAVGFIIAFALYFMMNN